MAATTALTPTLSSALPNNDPSALFANNVIYEISQFPPAPPESTEAEVRTQRITRLWTYLRENYVASLDGRTPHLRSSPTGALLAWFDYFLGLVPGSHLCIFHERGRLDSAVGYCFVKYLHQTGRGGEELARLVGISSANIATLTQNPDAATLYPLDCEPTYKLLGGFKEARLELWWKRAMASPTYQNQRNGNGTISWFWGRISYPVYYVTADSAAAQERALVDSNFHEVLKNYLRSYCNVQKFLSSFIVGLDARTFYETYSLMGLVYLLLNFICFFIPYTRNTILDPAARVKEALAYHVLLHVYQHKLQEDMHWQTILAIVLPPRERPNVQSIIEWLGLSGYNCAGDARPLMQNIETFASWFDCAQRISTLSKLSLPKEPGPLRGYLAAMLVAAWMIDYTPAPTEITADSLDALKTAAAISGITVNPDAWTIIPGIEYTQVPAGEAHPTISHADDDDDEDEPGGGRGHHVGW